MEPSVLLRKQLDGIADEFEGEWRAGKRPRLVNYLERHPQIDRSALLFEL